MSRSNKKSTVSLREGLLAMIRNGRLTPECIPNDFDWLVETLDHGDRSYTVILNYPDYIARNGLQTYFLEIEKPRSVREAIEEAQRQAADDCDLLEDHGEVRDDFSPLYVLETGASRILYDHQSGMTFEELEHREQDVHSNGGIV